MRKLERKTTGRMTGRTDRLRDSLRIGFTGTQQGMTTAQKEAIRDILHGVSFIAIHGGCVGADADFHDLCVQMRECDGIIIHPSNIPGKQMRLASDAKLMWVHAPRTPLERNRSIIQDSDRMLATPKEDRMVIRSGTWTTIRYARDAKRPLCIVDRFGHVHPENWW